MPDGRTNRPGDEPGPPHCPRYSPSGLNICTRPCCPSTTYTVEPAPTAIPAGALNCPAPVPWPPHDKRYAPSGPNFWTRAFPRSVTYTLPLGPAATPWGLLNWPGWGPDWPHDRENGWLELPRAAASPGVPHGADASRAAASAGTSRAAASALARPPPRRVITGFNGSDWRAENSTALSAFVELLSNFVTARRWGGGGAWRHPCATGSGRQCRQTEAGGGWGRRGGRGPGRVEGAAAGW